jgi:hypothetical protein
MVHYTKIDFRNWGTPRNTIIIITDFGLDSDAPNTEYNL